MGSVRLPGSRLAEAVSTDGRTRLVLSSYFAYRRITPNQSPEVTPFRGRPTRANHRECDLAYFVSNENLGHFIGVADSHGREVRRHLRVAVFAARYSGSSRTRDAASPSAGADSSRRAHRKAVPDPLVDAGAARRRREPVPSHDDYLGGVTRERGVPADEPGAATARLKPGTSSTASRLRSASGRPPVTDSPVATAAFEPPSR